jgi:integration host factor subunit alpha
MATLTKADLAKHLDEEIGLTNREAKEIVEFFFQYIGEALVKGIQVKLSRFGNFTLHDKKERPGRNPRTGEEVPVTARRVVTFHCGQKLKARVEKYAGTAEQEPQG